jgi:hypothetical protein
MLAKLKFIKFSQHSSVLSWSSGWVMILCSDVVGYQCFRGSCWGGGIHFTLQMEAAWSSETLVSYIIIWCHNTKNHDVNLHCHENLKSCNSSFMPQDIQFLWCYMKSKLLFNYQVLHLGQFSRNKFGCINVQSLKTEVQIRHSMFLFLVCMDV